MSQITNGLINDGKTAHFAISYEETMSAADGRNVAQGLMNVVENDIAVIRGWFGGVDFAFSYPINVELHSGHHGANWTSPADILTWFSFHPTITVLAVGYTEPSEQGVDFVRCLIVGEVTEMFMASKNNGWFEHTTLLTPGDEGSKGEGLSRFLVHEFALVAGLAPWLPDFLPVPLWLTSPNRPDIVNSSPDDYQQDVPVGGTTCFIYYLRYQLGFAIPQIINAGSTTLAHVYQKLTGRNDAWNAFIGLVNQHYPIGTSLGTTGDNIFPVPNLSWMDNAVRVVAGSSAQLFITLDRVTQVDVTLQLTSDDPATLQILGSVVISAGQLDILVTVQAQPVAGPPRTVFVHAKYADATISAPINILPSPSALTGVVTSVDGGAPINGAIVVIDGPASAGEHAEHMQLETGTDGAFSTPAVAPGDYTVEASAGGFVPETLVVTVSEGVPTTRADVALPTMLPFALQGLVVDAAHTALPGATVTLTGNSGSIWVPITTDSLGEYYLKMEPGLYTGAYTLFATLAGYVRGEKDLASIPNGATLTENFVLLAFDSVSGVITDAAAGTPVVGAQVASGTTYAASDAAGRYTLPQLAPGPAPISVIAKGFESASAVLTAPGGAALTQDFALVRASATLTGTISDAEDGGPVSGAKISVTGATGAESAADGKYTVGNIPAGNATITIKAGVYETLQSTIAFVAHETVNQNFSLNFPLPPGPPH